MRICTYYYNRRHFFHAHSHSIIIFSLAMTIEEALNEFESVLDQQFNAMDFNEHNHSPRAAFTLATPCSSSSEESETEDPPTTRHDESRLIVVYPLSEASPHDLSSQPNLNVVYLPKASPRNLSSQPNLVIPSAGIPRPAADAATVGALSAATNPPATYNLDGFALHLKNNNKKSVQYWCNERRNKNGDCKVKVRFRKNNDGIINYKNPNMNGTIHTFKCCQKNGVNVESYNYLGKELSMVLGDDTTKKFKFFPNFPVENEMKQRVSEIAVTHQTMLPDAVWTLVKKEMDEKYSGSWSGLYKNQVTELVRKSHAKLGLGDAISTVTDTKEYRLMSDMTRPFLQASCVWPHPDGSGE